MPVILALAIPGSFFEKSSIIHASSVMWFVIAFIAAVYLAGSTIWSFLVMYDSNNGSHKMPYPYGGVVPLQPYDKRLALFVMWLISYSGVAVDQIFCTHVPISCPLPLTVIPTADSCALRISNEAGNSARVKYGKSRVNPFAYPASLSNALALATLYAYGSSHCSM